MATVSDAFGDRVISEGLLPAHSQDLTPCDFYLWDGFTDEVYKNNPDII
jgi:hypothetical protein